MQILTVIEKLKNFVSRLGTATFSCKRKFGIGNRLISKKGKFKTSNCWISKLHEYEFYIDDRNDGPRFF